jgi:hypothetical protein
MIETKKLSRKEANAELAQRVGWPSTCEVCVQAEYEYHPGECVEMVPDFFTSRDAAAELAAWILSEANAGRASVQRFIQELELKLWAGQRRKDWVYARIITCMLATPEQLTLASCAALNIETE